MEERKRTGTKNQLRRRKEQRWKERGERQRNTRGTGGTIKELIWGDRREEHKKIIEEKRKATRKETK